MIELYEIDGNNTDGYEDLVFALLDFLQENKDGECKIYFDGESDGSQTKYETLSNRLEIGVLCSDERLAKVILYFVRMIVDDCKDRLYVDIGDDMGDGNYTIHQIYDYIANKEFIYMNSFSLHESIKRTLSGCGKKEHITKQLGEVDIWTVPRIKKEFEF